MQSYKSTCSWQKAYYPKCEADQLSLSWKSLESFSHLTCSACLTFCSCLEALRCLQISLQPTVIEKIAQLKAIGVKVGAGSSCTICILFLSKIDWILMDFVLCIYESAKHSKV